MAYDLILGKTTHNWSSGNIPVADAKPPAPMPATVKTSSDSPAWISKVGYLIAGVGFWIGLTHKF